jgi:hypothetical protein
MAENGVVKRLGLMIQEGVTLCAKGVTSGIPSPAVAFLMGFSGLSTLAVDLPKYHTFRRLWL